MSPRVSFDYSLRKPLPFELRTGDHNLFTRYKDHPVFSFGWWWRRLALSALILFVVIFSQTFVTWLPYSDPTAAALCAFLTMFSYLLAVNVGPGLATLVRHRNGSPKLEAAAIVFVIVVSTLLSLWLDELLRQLCARVMEPFPEATRLLKRILEPRTGYDYFIAFAYSIVTGGILAIPAYFSELNRSQLVRSLRKEQALRMEKQQADLRLSVLQAQVEPHFLFNTLASIRALIRQAPDQSEATLDALVEYLRASIPKLRDHERSTSTLGQQLDLCANYLEVMRLRTAGRLRYVIEADAALRALPFPPMLLITLAENAIKHGIEPKRGPGQVTISAACEDDRLRVSVIDDGVGLQLGVGSGLGLVNVRAQLDTLFDGRASFDLRNLPTGGVRAEMVVPLRESAA